MLTTSPSERAILTVSQLNRCIRQWLENDMGMLCLEGEVSNATQASSGHCYFTLKDSQAQLRCVFFRNRHVKNQIPQNGQLMLIEGRLSLYEARGDYQFIVESITESGVGALYRAFQLLKTKLANEGLFDAARKKSIPTHPSCIGVITSPTGAALHDIRTTLSRRYPLATIQLYPSDVQGQAAAGQLIQAIQQANQDNCCDVLILARGGGSLEDLWPFNNEALAYAIADSHLPIVSGVGHETDFTIADFVADLRAATPTAAAEAVTPDWQQLRLQPNSLQTRLQAAITRVLQHKARQFTQLEMRIAAPKRLVQTHWQTLDYLIRHLQQAIQQQLTHKRHALGLASNGLHAFSPLATLARGYAIATHQNQVLRSTHTLQPGDCIHVQLQQGGLECTVSTITTPNCHA